MAFEGRCRATGIGSLPFGGIDESVRAVLEFCPQLPHWPQLPKRSANERMNEQVLEGFPGLAVRDGKTRVVQDDAFFAAAEKLMQDHEAAGAEAGAMSPIGPLYGLKVYEDQSLAEDEEIAFNAGSHKDVIRMAHKDFARLAKPKVADFAKSAD